MKGSTAACYRGYHDETSDVHRERRRDWKSGDDHTADAVLLVLVSDVYDPNDYIRDYDEFMRERRLYDSRIE